MRRRIALIAVLVLFQVAILIIGALALRAGRTSGVELLELFVLLVAGVQLPLLFFMLRRGARRRIAAAVLATGFAFIVNVAFVANALPAAAVTDNSSVFTFARTTAFAPPNFDMVQNYSPSGASATCGTGSWTCTFSSDQFSANQSLNSGTAQSDLYLDNNAATIAFRNSSNGGCVNSTTCGATVPSGTIDGDVMVVTFAMTNGGGGFTITAPAGWSLVRRTDNGTTILMAVYWKAYATGDPSSWTWSTSAQTRFIVANTSYSGVDRTNPIDVENGQTTPSGTQHATPSVTTTGANEMVLTMHDVHAVATWTPPTGMTERIDKSNNGSGQAVESFEINEVAQATAGPTGTKTATATVADVGITEILALRPSQSCDMTVTLHHTYAPQYRDASSATVNSSTTITINKPANVVQNDVMVAAIAVSGGSGTSIPTPGGWTYLNDTWNGTTIRINVYRRVAGASEAASYSWRLSPAAYAAGGTSHATASITTTQPDELLVASFAIAANDTWSPPAGMTERVDPVTSTTFIAIGQADLLQTATAATGALTATASPTAAVGVTSLISLRGQVTTVGSATRESVRAGARLRHLQHYRGDLQRQRSARGRHSGGW